MIIVGLLESAYREIMVKTKITSNQDVPGIVNVNQAHDV